MGRFGPQSEVCHEGRNIAGSYMPDETICLTDREVRILNEFIVDGIIVDQYIIRELEILIKKLRS